MIETAGFFDSFYINSKNNCILILNSGGVILNVNTAFRMGFGFEDADVVGKNFSMLFTEKDQMSQRPERELSIALTQGAASDNNYLLHKDGSYIWTTGESVMVKNKNDETYIVKVVHNIHTQKLLETFLLESNEFIETLFQSIKDTALLVVDGRMKIIKVNNAFYKMFQLETNKIEGHKLDELEHPFWQDSSIQKKLHETIVTNNYFKDKHFEMETGTGEKRNLKLDFKLIDGNVGIDKRILLTISDVTE